MQRAGIAEEGKIGREVEGVEVGPAAGHARRGEAHRIEAQNLGVGWQISLEMGDEPVGIEAGNENRAGWAVTDLGERPGAAAEDCAADPGEILNEDPDDLDTVHTVNLGKTFRGTLRIDDRRRPVVGERGEESPRWAGGLWMGQRLVQRVAAAKVVEGVDAKGHYRGGWGFPECDITPAGTTGYPLSVRTGAGPVGAARRGRLEAHRTGQKSRPRSGLSAPRQRRPSPHRWDNARR